MKDFKGYESNIFSCEREGQTAVILLKEEAFRMSTDASYLQDMLDCIKNIEKDDAIKGLLVQCTEEYNGIKNIQDFVNSIKKISGHVKKEMVVRRYGSSVRRMTLRINKLHKPSVVCVHGKVPIDHFGYIMAFDFRIASEDLQIEFPGIKLGISPAGAASFYLSRQLGPTVAAELFLSGKTITAEEAYGLGIVSKIVPRDEIKTQAMQKLEALYEFPAMGYSMTKRMLKPGKHELENHFERSIQAMWSSIIDK